MTSLVGSSNASILESNNPTHPLSEVGGSDLPEKSDSYIKTQAVAEALTSGGFESFAGVVPNAENGTVDLYITEIPDSRMEEYLRSVKEVSIRVHFAKYSHQELEAGIKRISPEVLRSFKEGIDVYSAHASDAGSAIELTLRPSSSIPSSEWLDRLIKIARVSIVLKKSPEEVPDTPFALQTRTTPTDPWWGGALFEAGGYACSTGFGVVSNTTNLDYLMTARHCFVSTTNLTLRSYGESAFMGTWSPSQYYNFPSLDIALTFPSGQGSSDKVFTGAYNSNSNSGKTISGVGTNNLNRLVCVNGGNSGAHCSVKVIQTPATIFTIEGSTSGVVTGKRDNNSIVAASGDSGGPVVGMYTSSGFVFGYGIVHAGVVNGLCSSFNTPTNTPTPVCGNKITWIDLATALNESNMSLK